MGWSRALSMKKTTLIVVLLAMPAGFSTLAQDTRPVNVPAMPPVCVTLQAELTAPLTPADEVWLDTERLQAAIDHCAPGNAVELKTEGDHNAFLSGSLEMRKGVTVWIDRGVTVYASRDPKDFEVKPGSCGVLNDDAKRGCRSLFEDERANNSGVLGDGIVDGRGGARLMSDGKETQRSWWELAGDAAENSHVQAPQLIATDHADDFTVYRVTLKNAPGAALDFEHGDGLTVWGILIDAPAEARNAGGVEINSAKNVMVTQSYLRSGGDIELQAAGGETKNISLLHDHLYGGRGMAIGPETSGGVSAVLVRDVTEDAPENGLRITSHSGLVKDVTYEDVCIRKSAAPMELVSNNSQRGKAKGPVVDNIVMRRVRVYGGGKLQLLGMDASHRIGIQFDGVLLDDPDGNYAFAANHADMTLGPGPVNFKPVGEDSSLRGLQGSDAAPDACDAKFVPYPSDMTPTQTQEVTR